jgi:hypothetical protein
MWFPGDKELATEQAVIRSIDESFPHVRCFPSVAGWGVHMLASMEPIEQLTAGKLAERMPESARQDLLEWNAVKDAPAYLSEVLTNEYFVPVLLNPDPGIQITDDKPFNEYFLLRHFEESRTPENR